MNTDARIILVGLEALENILKIGEKDSKETGINEYATIVEECHGLDKLEQLQNHQNQEIYEKSVNILETYFAAEEEDQNVSPNINNGSFHFGMGTGNAPTAFNF